MPEYRTPGVYIEEVSGGPRPVQPSSTTDTGFIAVLTLPPSWLAGAGAASGSFLPAVIDQPELTWGRALAFNALAGPDDGPASSGAKAADAKAGDAKAGDSKASSGKTTAKSGGGKAASTDDNRLRAVIAQHLPGSWTVQPPNGADTAVTLLGGDEQAIRFPASRTMFNVRTADSGAKEWDLAFGADEGRLVQLLSAFAVQQEVQHSGVLDCVDSAARPAKIDVDRMHEALVEPAPVAHSVDGYHAWRRRLGERLFMEIVGEAKGLSESRAQMAWDTLNLAVKDAWDKWLRAHPGLFRLELALNGFFENGGTSAYIALVVQAHGSAGPAKRRFLEQSFDGVSSVAMLAAPGLELGWQQAILEYAGTKGRGDLFAVMEAPRYLLTREPRGVDVDGFRWTRGDAPFEVARLQTVATADATELRYGGYASDEVLDRAVPRDDGGYGAAYGPWLVVDNPLSTGPHDRYVIAPPAGHVAGVIAHTDLKAGGGVHKAPANEILAGAAEVVTHVSDREQGVLNVKGINIIRQRPAAGMRIWGARTTASDPLWTYISVRRLFLFVERSVRDAVQWAVFLPNSDVTRRDLADTISSFLYQLHNRGMLDGASWRDAFKVQCDRENNPDVDVRSGIMTVDVEFRPVYPAEFIRIRFRQSPMEAPA